MFQSIKYFLWLGLFIPMLNYALPTDNHKTVNIVSDSSTHNQKTGLNIFIGNVKVDQGETHLTADRLIAQNDLHHKIQEVIAYGTAEPAHYWTLPKEGAPVMHAKAKIIHFNPSKSTVILEDDVVLIQGTNSFKGPIIVYNMKDQTITVPTSHKGHATIVYDPDTHTILP